MEKVVLIGVKRVIKQLILVLGLCILWNCSAYSQVERSVQLVKAKTINRNLALQFPIDKSFQGSKATFSDAKILIDTLDQSIKLQMTVSAQDDQQHFVATLVFIGDMKYHDFSESYIFDNLKLDRFKVEKDSYTDSQHIAKSIKQSLINDFDELVLFNLAEINSLSFRRPADEIEISKEQLRFIWN
ncbi:hypothetical protein [Paraglaciecola arctica]|uniref:hypothetical protein n=1 Tax=Paraglaciecola arctica TaxID=1128911 RepID=UPI000587819E|nr:hypothetical protein [Paraglaciecola arctica]